MEIDLSEPRARFARLFGAGGKIRVIRAPGRVNLIGEHTDYNQGLVLPMAIEQHKLIVCRARDDSKVRLASTAFDNRISEFSLDSKVERGEPAWTNYVRGTAAELLGAGIPLVGMDMLLLNTLPVGGGLSSSAAILVGTATALLTLAGLQMDPARVALLSQKAEHEFALVPTGIMDQTVVSSGRAGCAVLLDCRDLSRHYVPVDPKELRVVIANTMIRHELAEGEYARRRQQCEQAVDALRATHPAIQSLRDVSAELLERAQSSLDPTLFRRARHVVTEIKRTSDAAFLLGKRRYEEVGKLMRASHHSLQTDYEVSCAELDFLSEEAMSVRGVYGARMTGGGFGGCIVALVQPRAVEPLSAQLRQSYKRKFNRDPEIYVTSAGAGVTVLE